MFNPSVIGFEPNIFILINIEGTNVEKQYKDKVVGLIPNDKTEQEQLCKQKFFDKMKKMMPEFIKRKDIAQWTFGLYSSNYISNLQSRNEGPKKVRVGNQVLLERTNLIEWIEEHSKSINS